jgi:hypothetical protein
MSSFIIYKKLTWKEALENARDIEAWFEQHPDRDDCVTDLAFTVRRGFVVRDILKHTQELEDA